MKRTLIAACLGLAFPLSAMADTLIVANKYDGTLSFIDRISGTEVKRAATGQAPHELALSPDQTRAVVVSYLEDGFIGHELNVFDVATASLIQTIDIAPHYAPHGIAWLGDSNEIIVTTEETRDVVRVDIDKAKVTGVAVTDQIGSHLLALSPDAERAYVTSRGSDTLSVVDTQKMQVIRTVAAGQGPEAVFVSPDNTQVWVGNNQSQDIMIYDVDTMQVTYTLDMGFTPIRVQFTPQGDQVAVADLHGNRIVVLDAADHSQVAVVDLNAFDIERPPSLLFSPDGAYLYVGSELSEHVTEISTQDWRVTRLLQAGKGADGMQISTVPVTVDSTRSTSS